MLLLMFAMAAALSGGAPSQAATAPQATPAPAHAGTSNPAADPDKVVCREEAETGSRFTKRVCHTNAEWAQMQAAAERTQDQIRNKSGMESHATSPFGGN